MGLGKFFRRLMGWVQETAEGLMLVDSIYRDFGLYRKRVEAIARDSQDPTPADFEALLSEVFSFWAITEPKLRRIRELLHDKRR